MLELVTPTDPAPPGPPPTGGRVSRHELARDRRIWLAHGVTLAFLAVATGVLAFAVPAFDLAAMLAFAALLAVGAGVFFATSPPVISSLESHLTLISVYGFVGIGELAYAPDWAVPLGAAGFVGTLVALRVETTRQIVAHLVAASVCLSVPAVVVGADSRGVLGLVAVLAAVWTLCTCCVLLFEAVEEQGRQLEKRLRHDPLTGVGNQRHLSELLTASLEHHARARRPLSIIALDLTNFGALNQELGRAAGDELLAQAATAIASVVREQDSVTRPIDDEFWIVLPETDALGALEIQSAVHDALGQIGTGVEDVPTLSAAMGVVSYPRDAVQTGVLVDLARDRMMTDQERGRTNPVEAPVGDPPPFVAVTAELPVAIRGLSRRDLAEDPRVWRIAALAFVVIMGFVATTMAIAPGGLHPRDALLAVCLLVCAALTIDQRPPAPAAIRNHLFVASLSVSVAVGFWVLQPDPGVALAVGVFAAPVIAVRLSSRRAIMAQLAGATCLLTLVGATGGLTEELTRATLLQMALLGPAMWSLGLSCMFALELAEEQGRALERLVRTDQVTGVGNRLLLEEHLAEAIDEHAASARPLSIVVVEIVETFENSRGASELLLRGAAKALSDAIGPNDTVIRRRGHEFVLVLPDAPPHAVDHTASAVFASLADLNSNGHRVECVHAAASFPADGSTADELLAAADLRLVHAGAPVGFKRRFKSP